MLVETADPPNGSPVMLKLMGVFRARVFVPQYLRSYRRVREFDRELADRWLLVRAVERLVDAPQNERTVLLRMLRAAGAPA